jgi:hypothetical protein
MMNLRRISAWKILGILAATITVAFGLLFLSLRSAESRRWEELNRLVHELSADVAKRDAKRPVLRGDPLPGDAWKLYGPLIREYDESFVGAVAIRPGWKAEAVESLRRGARRGSARNPYGEAWLNADERYPMDAIHEYAQASLQKALSLADWGRLRQAGEILLDAALFARDVGQNGNFGLQEGSFKILEAAFEELSNLLKAMGTDRETPRQIAAELEILDRSLGRSGYVLLNEIAKEARVLLGEQEWEWWGRDIGEAGWRYGFSRRLMAADGVVRMASWARRHLEDDDLPWGAPGIKRDDFIWEDCIVERNGLLRVAATSEYFWTVEGRDVHARLHLLRLAAHFLATGEVLPLPDPYALHLLQEREGSRLKAWSIGSHRKNEKGEGDWSNLVIEVTR